MEKSVFCVVDNTVSQGSQFWAEHGLSIRIEVGEQCLLFDTGHSETVLLHNLGLLGKCPRNASALVLSHAHSDHTGGLKAILAQKPGVPIYASPNIFRPRFSLREGEYKSIGISISQDELSKMADLRLSADPQEVLPGVWTTGEITRRSEFEGRSDRHFVADGNGWENDNYLDDMGIVLETSAGMVLICGCCHAGLLNTLAHVKSHFNRPIVAIMGGTHLLNASDKQLTRVVSVLKNEYDSPELYLNHCTGTRAFVALANAFGELVHDCPAGTGLTFD